MRRETIIASILSVMLLSYTQGQQEPKTMPIDPKTHVEPVLEQLRRMTPGSDVEMEALTRRVMDNAYGEVDEAIRIWRGPDRELAAKARLLLGHIEALALPRLLETAGTNSPGDDAWLLRTTAAVVDDTRKQVALRLNQLLQDKRSIPPSVPVLREEQGSPPRRVCDEAYILMRRFLQPTESPQQYFGHVNHFLNLPVKDKNALILKALQSPAWRQWSAGRDE